VTAGFKTATLSMDNYSFETVEMFKERLNQRVQDQNYLDDCQKQIDDHCRNKFQLSPLAGGNMKLYVAELTFDNIPEEPVDPAIKSRDYCSQLPTSFHLSDEQVDNLITVGGWLLKNNPDFREFMDQFHP
jgi:NTE family protein